MSDSSSSSTGSSADSDPALPSASSERGVGGDRDHSGGVDRAGVAAGDDGRGVEDAGGVDDRGDGAGGAAGAGGADDAGLAVNDKGDHAVGAAGDGDGGAAVDGNGVEGAGGAVGAAVDHTGGQRVALVIGATGLVGRELVQQLLEDTDYDQVRVFVRRSMEFASPKLDPHLVDFDAIDGWKHLLVGDALFSCLGTTLKAAGSKEAQFKVDHDYNLRIAEAAAENQVPAYLLVSSVGANARSSNFYLRTKGQLELQIEAVPIMSRRVLRPGPLDGDRKEQRLGERLTLPVLRLLPKLSSLARIRPMPADVLARAAREAAKDWTPGYEVIDAERLFALAADD